MIFAEITYIYPMKRPKNEFGKSGYGECEIKMSYRQRLLKH